MTDNQKILAVAFFTIGIGGAILAGWLGGQIGEHERAIVNLCMAQTNGEKGFGYCRNSIFGR